MSLGHVLAGMGTHWMGMPDVRHHEASDRLCELRRFDSNDDAVELVNLVLQRCQAAGYRYDAEEALTLSIWELADNCLAHAKIGHGFLAAQVLPLPTRSLHFAVADGGIGIRNSLAGTPHQQHDDQSAIGAAVSPRVTSIHDKVRGVGLPNLLKWVTAIGGVLTIRSGHAAAAFSVSSSSLDLLVSYSTVDQLDGTLVAGWVPC